MTMEWKDPLNRSWKLMSFNRFCDLLSVLIYKILTYMSFWIQEMGIFVFIPNLKSILLRDTRLSCVSVRILTQIFIVRINKPKVPMFTNPPPLDGLRSSSLSTVVTFSNFFIFFVYNLKFSYHQTPVNHIPVCQDKDSLQGSSC